MPCRCDGYEVDTLEQVRMTLDKRIEHLEGQLCNAQSLIHKLLKHIDAPLYMPMSAELRERAKAHIKCLVDHKRKEHDQDVERIQREVGQQQAILEQQLRQIDGQRDAAERSRVRLDDLTRRLNEFKAKTDEEILG